MVTIKRSARASTFPRASSHSQAPESPIHAFRAATKVLSTTPPSSRRREIMKQGGGICLPPELMTQLRLVCVVKRCTVSDAVAEAIRDWLEAHGSAVSSGEGGAE